MSPTYVIRTSIPDERGGTSYRYQAVIENEQTGGFRSCSATEQEWLNSELARLDAIRANDDPTEQDFLDALEVAEILMCRIDDMSTLDEEPAKAERQRSS